jgi:hypothetical protein
MRPIPELFTQIVVGQKTNTGVSDRIVFITNQNLRPMLKRQSFSSDRARNHCFPESSGLDQL